MNCGGCPGACRARNAPSSLSKRIPQVILVLFIVWIIAIEFISNIFFNQPKPRNKYNKHNKHRKRHRELTFSEKLINAITSFDMRIWFLIIFIVASIIFIFRRIMKIQESNYNDYVQEKWDDVMNQQQQQFASSRTGYSYDDDDYNDENQPRIRELVDEEDEAKWRDLIQKEKKEMEKLLNEEEEEKKKKK